MAEQDSSTADSCNACYDRDHAGLRQYAQGMILWPDAPAEQVDILGGPKEWMGQDVALAAHMAQAAAADLKARGDALHKALLEAKPLLYHGVMCGHPGGAEQYNAICSLLREWA